MAVPQNSAYGIQSTAGAVAVRNTKGKLKPRIVLLIIKSIQFP